MIINFFFFFLSTLMLLQKDIGAFSMFKLLLSLNFSWLFFFLVLLLFLIYDVYIFFSICEKLSIRMRHVRKIILIDMIEYWRIIHKEFLRIKRKNFCSSFKIIENKKSVKFVCSYLILDIKNINFWSFKRNFLHKYNMGGKIVFLTMAPHGS